jgi:hypothetical protein
MIKEHDEISEEDQDEETCNEDETPVGGKQNRMSPPYHKAQQLKRPYE